MRWLELQFETTHEASELISDYLSSLGADGVQIQDAEEIRAILADPDSLTYADDDFTAQLDPIVRIKAYFAEFDDGVRRNAELNLNGEMYDDAEKIQVPFIELERDIRSKLADFAAWFDIGAGYTGFSEVHEEDWAENWKKYYETLHLTERLVVNPTWIEYQPLAGEIVISLDPGSAFGTGTHETTALCAELLDELLIEGDDVLDLGTGSGILAIIAARLGAGSVEAIDIDRMTIPVAEENCRVNQVSVDVHQGELADARLPSYDLIVANIIADVIAGLTPNIVPRLAKDGLFLASGIIAAKAPLVLAAASAAGLQLLVSRERRDWHAMVFMRKSSEDSVCEEDQENHTDPKGHVGQGNHADQGEVRDDV